MIGSASREMPRYKSIKTVHALKIAEVRGSTLSFADEYYAPMTVDPSLFARYTPASGDYLVVYSDGYQSFSPAKAFDEGYVRL